MIYIKCFTYILVVLEGGLAIGTMGMMVAISAMNGLSVAGMAIGATIALPEMLKRNYDKRMITGVVQAGSFPRNFNTSKRSTCFIWNDSASTSKQTMVSGYFFLVFLWPLYLFCTSIYVCRLQPELGPVFTKKKKEIYH